MTCAIELEGAQVDAPRADQGHRTLVGPLHLQLQEHRIAIIGPNGSGKSTLLRLINGLVKPNRGRVRVRGLDTKTHGPEVRKTVGLLFSDPTAALIMPTPREDVELSLRRRHRDRQERAHAAANLLTQYGLHHCLDQSIYSLSGGERQLVALVSMIALRPTILVLDEPTTLLDLANTLHLQDVLAHLPQQLIIATHDLDWACHCERTLVMDGGVVVFDGSGDAAVEHYRTHVSTHRSARVPLSGQSKASG